MREPDYEASLTTRDSIKLGASFLFEAAVLNQANGSPEIVSFPDHFSPHGKNWSGERPIPFSFPAVAKIVT